MTDRCRAVFDGKECGHRKTDGVHPCFHGDKHGPLEWCHPFDDGTSCAEAPEAIAEAPKVPVVDAPLRAASRYAGVYRRVLTIRYATPMSPVTTQEQAEDKIEKAVKAVNLWPGLAIQSIVLEDAEIIYEVREQGGIAGEHVSHGYFDKTGAEAKYAALLAGCSEQYRGAYSIVPISYSAAPRYEQDLVTDAQAKAVCDALGVDESYTDELQPLLQQWMDGRLAASPRLDDAYLERLIERLRLNSRLRDSENMCPLCGEAARVIARLVDVSLQTLAELHDARQAKPAREGGTNEPLLTDEEIEAHALTKGDPDTHSHVYTSLAAKWARDTITKRIQERREDG